ncbi:hypothetical protein B0A49_13556 [Cryomyces minteri]|uniref:Uncharacterized protein n=1 Tax=Cryomyces minteri TaxID=331657 RepID=A0A4U0WKC9_9PEZI|nr:hypothetical protein B0A49_13556 [Cryomyces minteri]
MFTLASTAVKEPTLAVGTATSSLADSAVEPQLPPSPPLSSSQFSVASQQPSEPVLRLLRLLRSLKEGSEIAQSPWDKQPLLRNEYTELWKRLEEEADLKAWVELKLRYDYDYDTQHFIIRMPTLLHERFIVQVVARLRAQLEAIAGANAELRHIVDAVYEQGSWTVPLGNIAESVPRQEDGEEEKCNNARSPDHAFGYKDARWPSLVLEVSYSQKRQDLSDIAYNYVQGSGGSIKTVVGLDVEYTRPGKASKTKMATANVWRYKLVRDEEGEKAGDCVQDIKDESFRSHSGDSSSGNLAFTLADFIPNSILRTLSATAARDIPITIPFEHLCADLDEAEAAQASTRSRSGLSNTPPRKWVKRVREPAEEEEMDTPRERKYQALEDREERKVAQKDKDYVPPGSSTLKTVGIEAAAATPRRMGVLRRSMRRSRALEEG